MKQLDLKWSIGTVTICALLVVLLVRTKHHDAHVWAERDTSTAITSIDIIIHDFKCHDISGIELLDNIAVELHRMNHPIKIKVLGKSEDDAVEGTVITIEYENVRIADLLNHISKKSGVRWYANDREIVFRNS